MNINLICLICLIIALAITILMRKFNDNTEQLTKYVDYLKDDNDYISKIYMDLVYENHPITIIDLKIHRELCDFTDNPSVDNMLNITDQTLSFRHSDINISWNYNISDRLRMRIYKQTGYVVPKCPL